MTRLMTVVALAITMAWSSAALAQQGGGGGVGGMGAGGLGAGGLGAGGLGAGGSAPIDNDQDGYPADQDCDDGNAAVNPGAAEACNGVDDDCNGNIDEGLLQTAYEDLDGDGYGSPTSGINVCEPASGYVLDSSDCNDNHAGIFPTAAEYCDGIDNNCNGQIDEDCLSNDYDAGPTPSANLVSGLLLAAWLGFGAWRRRRAQQR